MAARRVRRVDYRDDADERRSEGYAEEYGADDEADYDEADYDEEDYDEADYAEDTGERGEPDTPEADGGRGARSGGGRLSAASAAQAGLRQIAELTGKHPEGVTAVGRSDDGGWVVGVEVLEDRRVPSSSDMLATYQAEVGDDGALLSYRRLGRYPRGRGDSGGNG